jgi:glucose/arabinose dehydrogenase
MTRPSYVAILLLLGPALAGCPGGGTIGGDDDDSAPDDDDASDDDDTAGLCDGVETASGTDVVLDPITTGLSSPTFLTHAGDGTGRLFVTEQGGRLKVISPEGTASTWLDLSSQVASSFELGLLSVAFHPNFPVTGRFFVYYSANNSASTLSEFTIDGDPLTDAPDRATERVLLTQSQPADNHNGGQIAFGPDGYLYIGLGDGGGGGDTYGNGQRQDTFLAKILRIDVDGGTPYGIPEDNPFIGVGDHRDETWAWGVRNPWRFSFDRETGELWIADVGQSNWEEIDLGVAGANYGWPETEGNHCFTSGCDLSAYEAPIFEWNGTSVTGGYVYRGCALPDLHGVYFYADYNYFNSPVMTLQSDGAGGWEAGPVSFGAVGGAVASFGEDEQGEVYAVDHTGGRILKVVPAGR